MLRKKFGEFIKLTLADCITDIVDNRGRNPEYYVEYSEHPILDNYLIKNTIHPEMTNANRYLDDKLFKTFLRDYLKKDMVVMTLVGNGIGNVTTIDNENIAIIQNTIGFVTKPEIITDRFLYYYLLQNQQTIKNFDRGSGQPSIKKTDLLAMEVNLPPLPTQQKIAQILSSLDDKIELNNKKNANLEQQAQALFKSWFVDFEPFGGEMPDGWKVGKLSEIADYLNGLAMQKFRPLEGETGLPVLKIKELRQGCCDESSEFCSPSSIKNDYIINDGDVIFSWSGTLLVDIWCGGQCGLNQHLFKVTSKTYDKWFYYMWTQHHLEKFIFLAADKATTMGHIKREELDKAEVIIPDAKTYEKMTKTFSPIIDTIIDNRVENRKLSVIRDNLLPELMSGNIDVESVKL